MDPRISAPNWHRVTTTPLAKATARHLAQVITKGVEKRMSPTPWLQELQSQMVEGADVSF